MKSSRSSFIGLLVVLMVAAGCSGESDDDSTPAPLSVASLNGLYSYADYNQTTSTTEAKILDIEFDGAGNMDVSQLVGTVTVTVTGTYTLVADGSFSMTASGDTITGKASGDATQVLLVDDVSAAGVEGTIAIMTKMSTVYSNASLNGEYASSGIRTDTGTVSSSWIGFNFDGTGNVDVSMIVGGVTVTISDTYTVTSDGNVTFGGAIDAGYISSDLNILTLVYDDGSSNAGIRVAVKGGVGHSAASVAGTYHFGEFSFTTASGPASGMGTMTLNADGSLAVTLTIAPGTTLTRAGTFTVTDPAGVLEFVVDSNTLVGAISADGQTVLYGDVVADATPELCIAIKQ